MQSNSGRGGFGRGFRRGGLRGGRGRFGRGGRSLSLNRQLVEGNMELSDDFDNLLHSFMNSIRPAGEEEKERLVEYVKKLMDLCEENEFRWKVFVLALIHKRYHILSPQAKMEKTSQDHNITAGDGERLIFYIALKTIWEKSKDSDNAAAALRVLMNACPLAGGTRDICTLIVDFVSSILNELLKEKRTIESILGESESLSGLVGIALKNLQSMENNNALNLLCTLAADLLDQDLNIIRSPSTNELPSTLHVFIPHRDRGMKRNKKQKATNMELGSRSEEETDSKKKKIKKVPDRQLANAVAEILIWSKTSNMDDKGKFLSMYENLFIAVSMNNGDAIKRNLHAMQTIIRKQRQQLNRFARRHGQMLSNQFALDASQVDISRIRRGKSGDITLLTKFANKKADTRVLTLVNLRFADPTKATRFASISELLSSWIQEPEDNSDEISRINRDIFLAKTKATVLYLQSVMKATNKSLLVASLDNSQSNHIASALISFSVSGALLGEGEDNQKVVPKGVRLLIGGEFKDVSSFQSFVHVVDDIASGLSKNLIDTETFMNENIATTKAVLNLIDRHLDESEVLMLLSSADISIPTDVMKDLTTKDCNIHLHDADSLKERLKREGAKKGDITISLAWETFDDLDLHVHIPSGEHIYHGERFSKDGLCSLDVDMNAGGDSSKEPVENVFAGDLDRKKEAAHGLYKVVVQNFSYHGSSRGEIPFRIVIEKNGSKETFLGKCVGSGSSSDVIVTEFNYSGRKIPFPMTEEEKTAFGTSNLVNITASTGSTLDSLGQLVESLFKLEHLDQARQLLNEDEEMKDESSRPEVAEHGTLEVTSRDLLQISLAKLPKKFHEILANEFGNGPTLAEECAKQVAKRMITDNIPLSELRRNGYPNEIIDLVKKIIATAC